MYIADWWNHRIRKVTVSTGIITTIAGTGASSYSGDNGPATSATFDYPVGVVLDSAGNYFLNQFVIKLSLSNLLGNVYISDTSNQRVRKVLVSTGIINTIAGTGTSSYSGDNNQATSAGLNYPYGVSLDSLGNIYIADFYNNRIRKVTVSTGIITTIAGTGTNSYSGDGDQATSASIYYPYGVALDASGIILLCHHIIILLSSSL